MNTCLITRAENTAATRIEKRQAQHTAASALLANELVNAMRAPDLNNVLLSTPGFHAKQTKLVDVFSDLFAGRDGDAALAELLGMVAAAARGESTTHRALVWIAARAAVHGEFHADDLVAAWNGEDE